MRVFYAIPNLPLLGFRQCCDKFLEFPQVLLCLKRPELPQMNQTTAASSVSERRLDHEDWAPRHCVLRPSWHLHCLPERWSPGKSWTWFDMAMMTWKNSLADLAEWWGSDVILYLFWDQSHLNVMSVILIAEEGYGGYEIKIWTLHHVLQSLFLLLMSRLDTLLCTRCQVLEPVHSFNSSNRTRKIEHLIIIIIIIIIIVIIIIIIIIISQGLHLPCHTSTASLWEIPHFLQRLHHLPCRGPRVKCD